MAALAAGQTTNVSGIARDAGAGVKGSLGYWATPSGSEVDFVWWRGRETVAIIVYGGERELEIEGTRVVPLETFLRRLHAGEILG